MQKQNFLCILFNEIQIRRFAFIQIIVLVLAILFCGGLDASGQTKRSAKKSRPKPVAKNVQRDKAAKTGDSGATVINSTAPVTILNAPETDYLSGEASVLVNPKQPTIVRLGLAQNAVSIVEFPASDGIYYIHEGNPKFASVFQSPTRESDRSITIYPGEGFVAARDGGGGGGGSGSGAGATPSATITLQMRSGLVLILELVPVPDLRKNAHRCVINYNRDEVVSARRAAGLAYNLGEDIKPRGERNTRATSKLVGAGGGGDETNDDASTGTTDAGLLLPVNHSALEISKGSISRKINERGDTKRAKTALELSRLVNARLADCLKNPSKKLGSWTDAKSGLSLAVSTVTEIDADRRLVVVAVRNQTTSNLRLAPGTPELEIQTADEKGNALEASRLERTYVETTSLEGLIPAGSTVYYALVYNAPVMGASQRLRVLVSHREAADAPTSVTLPNVNATKE